MQVFIGKLLNLLHVLRPGIFDLVGRAFLEFGEYAERPFAQLADGGENFAAL
ncbi:hypothetical protein D3C74_457680 [compost metagenome]